MTFQPDTGALLDRARKYERQGRAEEAAAAYANVADALEARADWFSAVAVRARLARALTDAGRTEEALRVLAAADRAAAGLPLPAAAEPRAVLDGQAAHVLAGAGHMDQAVGRAMAAVQGFRSIQDHKRADKAAVHAARLTVKRSGPCGAVPVLRDLLAWLGPASDAYRQVSGMLADAERQPDRDYDVLIHDPDVPTWGRFAHAMAVGAQLAVGNGVAWNSITDSRETREENRRLLKDSWSVTDSASWWEQMEALLKGENCDPAIQVVLDQRGDDGDRRAWHAAISAWCRDRQISPETMRGLVALAERIARYEGRFRADGLLAPDGRVESVLGYDFGRAVNMARWGLRAGYVDHETAEGCVLRAADLARRVYSSWASFSAGYVLGRMLRFDDGEFGEWYERSLAGHRILMQDPASPWRKLAWG